MFRRNELLVIESFREISNQNMGSSFWAIGVQTQSTLGSALLKFLSIPMTESGLVQFSGFIPCIMCVAQGHVRQYLKFRKIGCRISRVMGHGWQSKLVYSSSHKSPNKLYIAVTVKAQWTRILHCYYIYSVHNCAVVSVDYLHLWK